MAMEAWGQLSQACLPILPEGKVPRDTEAEAEQNTEPQASTPTSPQIQLPPRHGAPLMLSPTHARNTLSPDTSFL